MLVCFTEVQSFNIFLPIGSLGCVSKEVQYPIAHKEFYVNHHQIDGLINILN